jgi:vacuolar-type H+-ATPase subunit C/Vma6
MEQDTYGFLFAKLHAQWSRAVTGERLASLVQSRNDQALLRLLDELGVDTSRSAEIQKQILVCGAEAIGHIRDLLRPESAAAFYTAFLRRILFDNLKVILRHRLRPDSGTDLHYLLTESPALPHLPVRELVEAKTVNQFYRALPDMPGRGDLLPVLVELDETRNLFVAETHLDRISYAHLVHQAAAVRGAMRRPALALTRLEMDLFNVVMLIRNAEIYHLPARELAEMVVPGGRLLTVDRLQALCEIREAGRLAEALPRPYALVLARRAGAPLYLREDALWEHMYREAYRVFRDFSCPAATVAAFPFLKRFEFLNLARVYEGFRVGLDADAIRVIMIGLDHA